MDIKYLNIYNEISTKIENGELIPKTKLPSENDLMQKYDVSRDTVRKALDMLAKEGYIQKIKGKGSIVLDINKFNFPVSGLVSFKELAQKMEKKPETILVTFQLIKPDEILAEQLHISKSDDVWKVIRVRKIENENIILDKDFINKKIVPVLTEEVCKDSIYEYIENILGLQISFAKKEITVEKATEEDKRHLDLDGSNMVVVVKNYVYLSDATLFQYTESRHRTDKFRFVDFARRSN